LLNIYENGAPRDETLAKLLKLDQVPELLNQGARFGIMDCQGIELTDEQKKYKDRTDKFLAHHFIHQKGSESKEELYTWLYKETLPYLNEAQ
jgi:hypothetical protein